MDRPLRERVEVNGFLAKNGFASLSDHGLIPQLALFIEDEATFKRVLNLTAPEERTNCYEALRPHLSFHVAPLDSYMSAIAADAEARQLPVITKDGGLRAYNVPVVQHALDAKASQETPE